MTLTNRHGESHVTPLHTVTNVSKYENIKLVLIMLNIYRLERQVCSYYIECGHLSGRLVSNWLRG